MNGDAVKVLERLERSGRVPLYPREIAQSTGLQRSAVMDALWELEERGLVAPVTFRATNGDGRIR